MKLTSDQITYLFIALSGLAVIAFAAWTYHRGRQLYENGISAKARIRRVVPFYVKGRARYRLEIDYKIPDVAQPVQSFVNTPIPYREGEMVAILYLKHKPRVCVLEEYFEGGHIYGPLILFMVGAFTLVFAIQHFMSIANR